MNLHVSAKLCVLGTVLALVVTGHSLSSEEVRVEADVANVLGVALQEPVDIRLEPHLLFVPPPDSARLIANARQPKGPPATPTYTVRATGYNSAVNQTDSTPFITATGARTRFGIIAASRDLLAQDVPYGSLVRLRDLGEFDDGLGRGTFQDLLDQQDVFIVEDTLHRRKRQQIDVWFESYRQATQWGIRRVELEVIRYGREGPRFDAVVRSDLDVTPQFRARELR